MNTTFVDLKTNAASPRIYLKFKTVDNYKNSYVRVTHLDVITYINSDDTSIIKIDAEHPFFDTLENIYKDAVRINNTNKVYNISDEFLQEKLANIIYVLNEIDFQCINDEFREKHLIKEEPFNKKQLDSFRGLLEMVVEDLEYEK